MQKRRLIDFLADHAEALNRVENDSGLDSTAWLTVYGPVEYGSSLLLLLQLAQAVKRALVPVKPSALFQSDLGAQLAQTKEAMAEERPFPRGMWVSAAMAGAVAGLVGLLLLIVRFLSSRSRPAATAV